MRHEGGWAKKAWLQFIPNQRYQNTLHLIDRHIHVFHYPPVEHARWHMPITTLFLEVTETHQDNTFAVSETIADIWQIITRITVTHNQTPDDTLPLPLPEPTLMALLA